MLWTGNFSSSGYTGSIAANADLNNYKNRKVIMKINYNQWDEDKDYLEDDSFVPIKRFSNKERIAKNNKKIIYRQKRKKKRQEHQQAEESFRQFCKGEDEHKNSNEEEEYVDRWMEDTSY